MLKSAGKTNGFLIDGYPREIEQAKRFEDEVAKIECLIYLRASDETMKTRLLTNAKSRGRSDDTEMAVQQRIDIFHKVTTPVIDYYTTQKKVHLV